MFIELTGAAYTMETGEPELEEKGEIYLNPDQISGFYDNHILIQGNKIRVMETAAQIIVKMEALGKTVYKL